MVDFLDFLFPKYCVGCGKEGNYFCDQCSSKIKTVAQVCPVCEKASPFGQTHPNCQSRYVMNGFVSFFPYDGMIKEAIHKLKYKFVTDLIKDLMRIVFDNLKKEEDKKYQVFKKYLGEKKPAVVPIPLHWYKENTRGFNQAQLIARFISLYYKIPLNTKVLKRKKWTISQTDLSEKERKKNVENIFSVSPNILISQYPNILLIDDVWTTGSTLKSAGNVLKRAGVKEVWGLTIAR